MNKNEMRPKLHLEKNLVHYFFNVMKKLEKEL